MNLNLEVLVFVEGEKPSVCRWVVERTQVTLVGASAIPPFQFPLCDYNLENLIFKQSCEYSFFIFHFFVLSFYFFFF